MKIHTTNYYNTFIEIAEDCAVLTGAVPPVKGENPTIAKLQYDKIKMNPYQFSSDEVLFSVFAGRKEIPESEWEVQRQIFFSKGQPCFRASPLSKSYGWGIHFNAEGKIALYGRETAEYSQLMGDGSVKKLKAMRSKRK